MTVSWFPVVIVDGVGSMLTLLIAIYCAILARKWTNHKPDDIFRQYIFLLTLSIVFFAVSRSFGHLIKQLLLFYEMKGTWQQISPFSGAINTATFIVVFAFGIYFHRFQKVNLEMERYKNDLEKLVEERTADLEDTNAILEDEITEKRVTEKKLIESKSVLENVLNNSNPLCITSVDFDLLQANESYYAIWPSKSSGANGLKCYDSRPGSLCRTESCPLVQITQGKKEEVIVEASKRESHGELLEFIITARPFRDATGNLLGIVENFQDITQRKKAEEALASERERLAVTLRSIGDGVITTDISGKIIFTNKIAEELTGWPQAEAFGKSLPEVFNIIHEKIRTPCDNPADKVLKSGNIVELANHTILIARDGTERIIADSGAPIQDANSNIIGVVLVFRDITEKIFMEEEIQKVKKLESIGVLAGGIAHDFNNLLMAILGNIDLAVNIMNPEDKAYSLLRKAEKASWRAKDLTQQLLTFSKGGDPIKTTAALPEVIRESADFVLHGEKTMCQYDIPTDLWLVEIDKGQMSQVIQNLIMNAKQAMPEGGAINITCENINNQGIDKADLPLPKDRNYIKITIKDSGCGIPADVLDNIFDPYFSTKGGGSGLGLAVTHSIISKHEGHISAQSTPGKGSTFTIYLPVSDKGIQTEQKKVKILPIKGTKRIMVMDDEEMVRITAQEMLKYLNLDVLLAEDGLAALELYKAAQNSAEPIDLVIMDLTIPGGMGGQVAVQELKKLDPEAKVIVASGYSNDPVMANFKEYGFCAALSKPYKLEELERLISQILE